ncbi:MAG: hypothetical protein ABID38_06430 [Candidatus Diapherotrites archaeon]
MLIRWSKHAKQRFAERAAKHGLNYGEIELAVKKQEVKVAEGKNRFKTIFKVQGEILTAVKIETKKFIHVLTLWEANEKEVEKWRRK